MAWRRSSFFLAGLAIALGWGCSLEKPAQQGCTGKSSAQAAEKSTAPGAANQPVIGILKTTDRIIVILAGPEGPRYSIKSRAGQMLGSNLTDKQLEAVDPDIYKLIQQALAGPQSKGNTYLDARIQTSPR